MAFMLADGAQLAYDEQGDGPAVLLLHGFPLCRAMWRPQVRDLVAAGYRVIVPDLRGFGESDQPQGACAMERYADDQIALLDQLQVEQAVVVGMSMGGYVLFNLLRRFPERIAGAVLCVTRSVADDEAARTRRVQLAGELMRQGPQVAADAFVELLFAPDTPAQRPKLVEEVYSWMVSCGSVGLSAGLLAMRDREDATPLLAQIAVPTLVIAAQQDRACPQEHAEMMARGVAGAQLALLPEGGHLVNLEQPNRFNQALLDFLHVHYPTASNDGTVGCRC